MVPVHSRVKLTCLMTVSILAYVPSCWVTVPTFGEYCFAMIGIDESFKPAAGGSVCPRRRGRVIKERRATSEAHACPQLRVRCLTRRAQWFHKADPQCGSDSSQLGDSTASHTDRSRGRQAKPPAISPLHVRTIALRQHTEFYRSIRRGRPARSFSNFRSSRPTEGACVHGGAVGF